MNDQIKAAKKKKKELENKKKEYKEKGKDMTINRILN